MIRAKARANSLIGVDVMPFVKSDPKREEKILEELMQDPEVKQHMDELDKESEFRQRLVQARKDAGIQQKTIGMMTGLDQRAISRVETNKAISPNLRTLVKYVSAIGYELDLKKATAE